MTHSFPTRRVSDLLAPAPALRLLDEPFSNLDTETRQHLAGALRGLLRASGAPELMVTHDQGEAFAMADHVGVMHGGRILQWDTPHGLYPRTSPRHVAGFLTRNDSMRETVCAYVYLTVVSLTIQKK